MSTPYAIVPLAVFDGCRAGCAGEIRGYRGHDHAGGFLSRERIATMRPGVILVNTARGAMVDETAMIDALKSGHIRHAGLDVFNIEPLPADHPLTKLPNVTLSAHSAFRTPEASDNLIGAAWEHCRRITGGT